MQVATDCFGSKRQRVAWLLIASLFCATGSATSIAQDVETRLSTFRQEFQKSIQGGVMRRDIAEGLIDQLFDGLNISELSVGEIVALTSERYLPARVLPVDISTALSERILALKSLPNVEGAQMAIADLEMKVNSDVQRAVAGGFGPDEIAELLSAQRKAFRETHAHPGFDDAVRSGRADRYFTALQLAIANNRPRLAEQLLALEQYLSEDLTVETVLAFAKTTQLFRDPIRGEEVLSAVDFERLRGKLLVAFQDVIVDDLSDDQKTAFASFQDSLVAGSARLDDLVGKVAPEIDFEWTSVEQSPQRLSDLQGQVVIIEFWAYWCSGCVQSMPHLREMAKANKDKPLAVLGVTSLQGAMPDGDELVETKGEPQREFDLMTKYMQAKEITWPVAFASESVFDLEYGVKSVPHFVVISKEGRVVLNATLSTSSWEDIEAAVQEALEDD